VPTASRCAAAGDRERLRALAVRGTRYTLALVVPLCVTLMTLAEPILEVWLGKRYGDGAAAMAILVSYWLLYGGLIVTPGFLVGAGRAPQLGRVFAGAAALNIALALLLTPELGLEGPALATSIPFLLAFPILVRIGMDASGARLGELARRAWLPAYSLGALLAVLLVGARLALEPDSLAVVMALAVGAVLGYWAVFYALVLEPSERGLLSRRG
jgi:O-antigen/teichoic acid export membrane protein